jgi:hypothetical protein
VWVAVRLLCATRVRLIYAGLECRRTMVRRGEPLSKIERGQPEGGGLLIARSRVPRACRAATDPADGMKFSVGGCSLDLGDRPHEPGEFAGGRDRDDRAAFRAGLKACPGAMQPALG